MTRINSTGYTVYRDLRFLNGDQQIRKNIVCWIFSDDNCAVWKFLWMHTKFLFVEDVTKCRNVKHIAAMAAIIIISSSSR